MRRLTIVLAMFVLGLPAYSQEDRLDLKTLVRLALERNPRIRTLQHLAEAQKFKIKPEGALPDPIVGFSFKNMGIDRLTIGEEMMSGLGFSISQMIPFPGKLRLKSEIASSRALQADENLKAAKLALVRQTKELYARLFYYHKSVDLLKKKMDILSDASKIAEVKLTLGKGLQSDIFKAQVEISALEEMILTMEQMIKSTQAEINAQLDLPAENSLGIPVEIPFYELPGNLSELQEEAARSSPVLRESEFMIQESRREIEMAKKEFYPNFMIQAGKDFKGRLPDMYEVMIGVEIPLYYKRKQADLLEGALAKLDSSKTSYSSLKNEVGFAISDSFIGAKTSENLIKLYKEKIIPQAALALESSLASYQVDKVDFLMVLSNINSIISYETDYYKNLSNLWSSTARIEEFTALEFIQ